CHQVALREALNRANAENERLRREQEADRKAAEEAALRARDTSQEAAVAQPVVQTMPPPPKPRRAPEYMSIGWANEMTKNSGVITPLADASTAKEVCMTFSDMQTVNGQSKTVYGKACRGSDGDWHPT